MNNTTFLHDILSQPASLEADLNKSDLKTLDRLSLALRTNQIDRIVITGMGASYYGSYPAWLLLIQQQLNAFWIDTAELLHYARALLTPKTMLWVVSQSGRSAELLPLIEPSQQNKIHCLLATVNDLESPLAKSADIVLPICAAPETTVSTRTYLNSLAINQLAALHISGQPTSAARTDLEITAGAISQYLTQVEDHYQSIKSTLGKPLHIAVLGRGPSMAAAFTGALIIGEAAKYPALALNAAEFRHGPMEMIHKDLIALVFAGDEATLANNRRMAAEIIACGARSLWIAHQPDPNLPHIPMPAGPGFGLPLAETIPVQLLTLAMAEQRGADPDKFLHSGKITTTE